MQKGFSRNYGDVSTQDKSRGGSRTYWEKRVALKKVVCDWEAKKAADLAHKRKLKFKLERLQMIKELAEL
jgi:hypothetical protein